MALRASVYHLQIELSDVDRGVYQALDRRIARHPSESMDVPADANDRVRAQRDAFADCLESWLVAASAVCRFIPLSC